MRIWKRSKEYFFAYYFQNMLELVSEPSLYDDYNEKLKDIRSIIVEYKKWFHFRRNCFRSYAYLWQEMKEYYFTWFCNIHYWSIKLLNE